MSLTFHLQEERKFSQPKDKVNILYDIPGLHSVATDYLSCLTLSLHPTVPTAFLGHPVGPSLFPKHPTVPFPQVTDHCLSADGILLRFQGPPPHHFLLGDFVDP